MIADLKFEMIGLWCSSVVKKLTSSRTVYIRCFVVRKPVLDPADVTYLGLETSEILMMAGWLRAPLRRCCPCVRILTASVMTVH